MGSTTALFSRRRRAGGTALRSIVAWRGELLAGRVAECRLAVMQSFCFGWE